jgi:hypothetical protein
VTFTSTMPTGKSSAGVKGADRTIALNGFQYTALDPAVALEWVRTVAAAEVWKVTGDVAWPAAGVNLWSYLAGDAWADLPGATRPHEGGDTDSLALPATDRILLVQMEPRDPDAAAGAGEVQRLAVWYDEPARAWKAWLWTVPKGGAAAEAVAGAVIVASANGGWAVSDEPAAVPAAYLILGANGAPSVDDAAVAGVSVRVTPQGILGVG